MSVRREDAAVSVAEEQRHRPARTWGATPWSPRLLRIDHVFVEGLRPLDFRVVLIPGSDQSGVVVEVVPG